MPTGFYTHPDCLLHDTGAGHPECAARLRAIEDQLIASRIDPFIRHERAPAASLEAIGRAHDAAYIDSVRAAAPEQGLVWLDPDTMMSAGTWNAVLRGAGAALAATDAVIAGTYDNAFCSVRPPGHHAERARAMGFCIFNNVAVAARHALEVHGLTRVAIIDFDVHHGNGTEQIFAGDPAVLMCGFFQHPYYPFTGDRPAPNMANVPLPARSGGDAVREAVTQVWLPRLDAFKPEMIFVSAGFDAHREDDMADMALVEQDYTWLTQRICEVADRHAQGRIVSCLEGGYDLSALGRSVVAHLKVLADL